MKQQTGAELIAAERQRQIQKEGYTPEHDSEHSRGDLWIAAGCYLLPFVYRSHNYKARAQGVVPDAFPFCWPWLAEYWKPAADPHSITPQERVKELTKSGALIAAEIDRIQRGNITF